MIGISVNGVGSMNIGHLPNRVSPALYVVREGNIVALAGAVPGMLRSL